MLLNVGDPVTISPQRPTDDGMGNPTWTDLDPTDAVVVTSEAQAGVGRGVTFTHSGTVFVPRDYALRAADRFAWQGTNYTVYGAPQGDQDHPLTGGDFGWKWFEIRGGQ